MNAGSPEAPALDATDARLIDHLHAGFPITDRPFARIGEVPITLSALLNIPTALRPYAFVLPLNQVTDASATRAFIGEMRV